MRYWDWESVGLITLLVAVAAILFVGAYGTYQSAQVDRQCLAAGYSGSNTTIFFEGYCIKRVDQTDVVVPLEEVRK